MCRYVISERVMYCRMIEKIEKNEAYAKRLGIENVSKFRGKHNDDNKGKG